MSPPAVPHIVVLDGHTLTSLAAGDTSAEEPTWNALAELGTLEVFPRTPPGQVSARARGAAVVLTNKAVLSAETIYALPQLRFVSVLATGTNVVDLAAARAAGVVVSNVPGYSTESVVQHVFALLLELMVHLSAHNQAVHQGGWAASADFSFTVAPTIELSGKTLGIVGLGSIGSRVARVGHALGMRVVAAHQRSMHSVDLGSVPVTWMPVDDLFAQADVITLHCPLTDTTHHLVNAERLALVKPSTILINTGRGPLVDEPALASALDSGGLAGAGLDVLSTEPPAQDNPLLRAPRCVITPHVAWATREARHRLMQATVANVTGFLAGRPINVVN